MDPAVRLQPHLRPDEQLLWYGVPDPRVWFAPADVFMVPVSIFWCAFAVFWEHGASAHGGLPFALFGIVFIAVGVYFVFGRFIYKHYSKKGTTYGISTRRALIVRPGFFADMPLEHQAVTVKWARDSRHASVLIGNAAPGTGFRFGQPPSWFYANSGLELLVRNGGLPFAFYDVADAEAMLHALDQARTQQTA